MNYKLGYKEYEIKVAESTADYISKPHNVIDCLIDDYNPVQEELYVLILNAKNHLIEKHLICKGDYGEIIITPAEICRTILLTNGKNIILAHNHTSNDASPSEEDFNFTKKIKKSFDLMGFNLLDHIIYTNIKSNYYSFKKSGDI